MSKLKIDNIKFDDDDFVVEVKNHPPVIQESISKTKADITIEKTDEDIETKEELEQELTIKIQKAQIEADEIIQKAQLQAQVIIQEAQEIEKELVEKQKNLDLIEKEAKEKAQVIIQEAKEQIEQEKTQAANEGYKDGYNDAKEKIQEELEGKIKDFDNFCSQKKELEEKILKKTTKDIVEIIQNISSKIIMEKLDENILEKIIKNTIALFEKKEEIKIILSEKYAKMLYELQKKSLGDDIEFDFSDFKQYENFEIIYNPKFDDDTIILENNQERFDSSLSCQLDAIIKNIEENLSNKPFDDLSKEL